MSTSFLPGDHSAAPVGALRRFAQKRAPERPPVQLEHCELCSEVVAAHHHHLLDLTSRALLCACQACSLLFSEVGAGGMKYKLVPQRYRSLVDFHMNDQQWDELMIPVNMAFLFRSSGSKQVMAFYPSPAGAIESLLDLAGWETLLLHNPVLLQLELDVEALLINRVQNACEYYLVPIDACYQLVGLIRISWKGLSGGVEAREAISQFFAEIRAKSQLMGGDQDA